MQVRTEPDELQNYLTDASNMSGGYAEKLFLPESASDVAEVLREASEQKKHVTVCGARTGTVGGAIAFGGYLVSLEKLNKIKEVSKAKLFAEVEAGVVLTDLQRAVERENLFYPPDPTEWSCQIGGTVAANASGARSFKYGATRKFVERLEIVLANGDFLDIKRGENFAANGFINLKTRSGKSISAPVPSYRQPNTRKNASGYHSSDKTDAIDFFIGSEGTLGVITEIDLKILPKPEGFLSGIVFFKRDEDLLSLVDKVKKLSFESRAGNAVIRTANASRQNDGAPSIDATLLEYFDANSLSFIKEQFPETPEDMAGAIFFEQETTSENEDALFEQWNTLLEECGAEVENSWFTTNVEDATKMREFRHALPVGVNERVVRNRQRKIGTDMAVPDQNFASFLKFYKEKLNESGLDYVVFGHVGDCHLHANILPKTDDEAVRAKHLYGRFVAQAIMLGGTISAEHGIGKLKKNYLHAMFGERFLNEMAELKRAFDPRGILNRGNIFEEKHL